MILQYEIIRFFDDSIYTRKTNIIKAEQDQRNLLKKIQQKLMINLGPDQKKVRIKKMIMKVHMFFMRVEN